MAVVAAQFGKKSFNDGKDGVLSLAREQGAQSRHWQPKVEGAA